MLIWAFILLLFMAMSTVIPEEDETAMLTNEALASYSAEEKNVLSFGSYADVVSFRFFSDPLDMGGIGNFFIFISGMISVLGMFLLGAFVARKKMVGRTERASPFA